MVLALVSTAALALSFRQEHQVAKVEEYMRELFDKTKSNEMGLEDSLELLHDKVWFIAMLADSRLMVARRRGASDALTYPFRGSGSCSTFLIAVICSEDDLFRVDLCCDRSCCFNPF